MAMEAMLARSSLGCPAFSTICEDTLLLPPAPAHAPLQVELSAVASAASNNSILGTSAQGASPTARTLSSSLSRRLSSRACSVIDSEAAYTEVQQLASCVASAEDDAQRSQQLDQMLTAVRGLCNNLCAVAEGLAAKERENENLTRVLRELSESRAEAVRVKVLTLESYHKLQDEHMRVLKSTQLVQQASRTHSCKAQRLRSELSDSREELHKARKQVAALQARVVGLRADNDALKRQVAALERSGMGLFSSELCGSACMQHFTSVRPMSLY